MTFNFQPLKFLKVMSELFAHFVFIYYDYFKIKTTLFLFILSFMRVIITQRLKKVLNHVIKYKENFTYPNS